MQEDQQYILHYTYAEALANQGDEAYVNASIFAKRQAREIEQRIKALRLPHLTVSDIVVRTDAKAFSNMHLLGVLGICEESVLIASARTLAKTAEKPILPVILPPHPKGSPLLRDANNNPYADFFWLRGKKGIFPVLPSQPVPLDGVMPIYTHIEHADTLPNLLTPHRELVAVTEDKYKTKTLLVSHGIPVPEGSFVPKEAINTVDEDIFQIANQFPNGFIVKGNTGSGGVYVKFFSQETTQEAIRYARHLMTRGKDILLEEQLHPVQKIIQPKGLAPEETDYNVRVLTTVGQHAKVVDAEVRFGKKGKPINIFLGAHATRLLGVFTPGETEQIYSLAKKATAVLSHEVGITQESLAGFVGLDIMFTDKGPVVLEANSGAVGGLGTLARIDRTFSPGIANVLLPSFRPLLTRLEKKEKENPPQLTREQPTPQEKREMVRTFIHGKKPEGITDELASLLVSSHTDDIESLAAAGTAFGIEKDTVQAKRCIDAALSKDPSSIDLLARKAIIHLQAKEYDIAHQTISEALYANPDNPFLSVLKAEICFANNDTNGAAVAILHGLHFDPSHINLRRLYARVLIKEGRVNKAEHLLWNTLKDQHESQPFMQAFTIFERWLFEESLKAKKFIQASKHTSFLPLESYFKMKQKLQSQKEHKKPFSKEQLLSDIISLINNMIGEQTPEI